METLHEHDIKFSGTGTSQICKVKKEFKVTTAGAGEVLTWEVLETGLCTIACLEARFVHWYVGVVVTFTTLTGTETILIEWLVKKLWTLLWRTLTAHSLKWVTEALYTVWVTETWTHSFLALRDELSTKHLRATTGTGLMEDMEGDFWTGLIKEL